MFQPAPKDKIKTRQVGDVSLRSFAPPANGGTGLREKIILSICIAGR
jgi:hypothetical protein